MKSMLKILILIICLAVIVLAVKSCKAGQSVTTAKYKIGNVEFIAVLDVSREMPKTLIPNQDNPMVAQIFKDKQGIPASINAFVVKTKDKTILIDAGNKGGNIVKNLQSISINPQDVNIIFLTHMHGDHVGGLLDADNNRVFTNAVVYVNKAEYDYWLKTPYASLVKMLKKAYGDNLKFLDIGKNNVVAEITPIAAPGHTPGHTIFEIASNGDKILVIGDLMHIIPLQTADPSISIVYDTDQAMAAKTRAKILKYVCENNIKIAGIHVPFPAVGKIIKGEAPAQYQFQPLAK